MNGIASTCGQAKKELELFHEKDRHLNLEMTNLPEIEQKTRAAIESTETKQLLFSSGKKFEVPSLHSMMFTDQLEGLPKDEEVEELEAEQPPAAPIDRTKLPARFTRPTKGWRGE